MSIIVSCKGFCLNNYVCHYIDDGRFNFRISTRYKITDTYSIDLYLFATVLHCPINFL
jgi:hypothetical protein